MATAVPIEQRAGRRKSSPGTVAVVDAISGQPLGQLGNLSLGGVLLISPQPLAADSVHQVRLHLPGEPGGGRPLEFGVQIQWREPAASPGQCWNGCRIISASEATLARIEHWLD